MPLPAGMSLQCGGAEALGKRGLRGGGGVLEGRWKCCRKGFRRWKGGSSRVLARGSSMGSSTGSSRYGITRFTCIPSSFRLQWLCGRNWYSGTSRWPSRRLEGTVQHLWWIARRSRGRPARWWLGQRVQQRSREPWPSSCSSLVISRGRGVQCGNSQRYEGGVQFSGRSEGCARQEASRVNVWRWKRAAPVLVVPDVP